MLALAASACILSACGAPPELAPQPPVEQPHVEPPPLETLPLSKPPAARPPAPAPIGEIARPRATAVIHVRPAPPRQPPRINRWKRIKPFYEQATAAAADLRFARAEQLFRKLRDHEFTPCSMRRRFHEKVVQFAAIQYGLRQVQRELMRHDFVAAARSYDRLSQLDPGIPFRVFFPFLGPRTAMNPGR